MRYIFIVNPKAGTGDAKEKITEALKEVNVSYEIYETKEPLDASRYVRKCCEEAQENIRFFSCGGDGTLNEVANGIYGHSNAELGCFPCGSGNDFIKCYKAKEYFEDVRAMIDAPSQPIDLLKIGDTYSINVVNFGFDTCVAKTMIKIKDKAIIGRGNAYKTGVFWAALTAMKNKAEIYVDDVLLNESHRFLLCTVANGQYVGGCFRCAPRSLNNDGFIDVCMLKPISLFKFLKMLGPYTEGKHLDDPRFTKIIEYRRCRKLSVKAPYGFSISVDGEIIALNQFTCEIVPQAINFIVPPSGD